MKDKHVKIRIQQCLALAEASECPRRKFGALLVDPVSNILLVDGYNGGPRGGGSRCGGETCLRDTQAIPSGTRVEIGCHHAEMNAICNAARIGVSLQGSWMFMTGELCLLCAKLAHHAGISRVVVVARGYLGENGTAYLRDHGVEVVYVDGPADPRGGQPQ